MEFDQYCKRYLHWGACLRNYANYLGSLHLGQIGPRACFPAKVIKMFALEIVPLAHIINTSVYANLWKLETVTPVPKIFPPLLSKHLRKISVFMNFSKVTEQIISEYLVADMEEKLDKSQFGNQKQTGVQHYLLKLVHKILCTLDKNSKGDILAVFANLYDWRQAFDLQWPKLGLESFVRNGVRPALLLLLKNYFQNRKMVVKWLAGVRTGMENSIFFFSSF